MTNHERNEGRIETVIALLKEIIEATEHESENEDADQEFLRSELVWLRQTVRNLDIVSKTYDLPYVIDDQPSWNRSS